MKVESGAEGWKSSRNEMRANVMETQKKKFVLSKAFFPSSFEKINACEFNLTIFCCGFRQLMPSQLASLSSQHEGPEMEQQPLT